MITENAFSASMITLRRRIITAMKLEVAAELRLIVDAIYQTCISNTGNACRASPSAKTRPSPTAISKLEIKTSRHLSQALDVIFMLIELSMVPGASSESRLMTRKHAKISSYSMSH